MRDDALYPFNSGQNDIQASSTPTRLNNCSFIPVTISKIKAAIQVIQIILTVVRNCELINYSLLNLICKASTSWVAKKSGSTARAPLGCAPRRLRLYHDRAQGRHEAECGDEEAVRELRLEMADVTIVFVDLYAIKLLLPILFFYKFYFFIFFGFILRMLKFSI